MLETEDTKKTDAIETEIADEQLPSYPCKWCQKATRVVETFPAYETDQWPIKIVKRRRRQCTVCGRKFLTQEESLKDIKS